MTHELRKDSDLTFDKGDNVCFAWYRPFTDDNLKEDDVQLAEYTVVTSKILPEALAQTLKPSLMDSLTITVSDVHNGTHTALNPATKRPSAFFKDAPVYTILQRGAIPINESVELVLESTHGHQTLHWKCTQRLINDENRR